MNLSLRNSMGHWPNVSEGHHDDNLSSAPAPVHCNRVL